MYRGSQNLSCRSNRVYYDGFLRSPFSSTRLSLTVMPPRRRLPLAASTARNTRMASSRCKPGHERVPPRRRIGDEPCEVTDKEEGGRGQGSDDVRRLSFFFKTKSPRRSRVRSNYLVIMLYSTTFQSVPEKPGAGRNLDIGTVCFLTVFMD